MHVVPAAAAAAILASVAETGPIPLAISFGAASALLWLLVLVPRTPKDSETEDENQ
jgi:hypothetical protein